MWKCAKITNDEMRMYIYTCTICSCHCVLTLSTSVHWLTVFFFRGRWGAICFPGLRSERSFQNFKDLISRSPLATEKKSDLYSPSQWKSYQTFQLEATVWGGQISHLWSIFEWHTRVVWQWEFLLCHQARQTLSCWGILVVLTHFTLRKIKYTVTLQVSV